MGLLFWVFSFASAFWVLLDLFVFGFNLNWFGVVVGGFPGGSFLWLCGMVWVVWMVLVFRVVSGVLSC